MAECDACLIFMVLYDGRLDIDADLLFGGEHAFALRIPSTARLVGRCLEIFAVKTEIGLRVLCTLGRHPYAQQFQNRLFRLRNVCIR